MSQNGKILRIRGPRGEIFIFAGRFPHTKEGLAVVVELQCSAVMENSRPLPRGPGRGRHETALLILDMLNTFDFPEAHLLVPRARAAAAAIAALKKRLKKNGVPVIYVNDNFGRWRSDWKELFTRCIRPEQPGNDIALVLQPDDEDYFILKPKHSAFYCTNLDVLLESLGVKTLILTGIAGNICVLFTANDAHMRDYRIIVPRDCMASNTAADDAYALRQFENVFRFQTPRSRNLRLPRAKKGG